MGLVSWKSKIFRMALILYNGVLEGKVGGVKITCG